MNNTCKKEASPYGRWPRKRGLSCVEWLLAVEILVIVVLYQLPLIDRPNVKAQYSREALPVISNLRVKVELFRIEKGQLPGLGRNADGSLAQTSWLSNGLSGVQTFCHMNAAEYAVYAADFGDVVAVTNGNHAFREIDVHWSDLTGTRLRPKHIQYRADVAESNRYCYVLGAFGDGEGLKAGTGYAVLEFNNPAAQSKGLAMWKRYKPVAEAKRQIVMVNAEEARRHFNCETPEQAAKMNLCWVGDTEALMSGDKALVEKALQELELAGWQR